MKNKTAQRGNTHVVTIVLLVVILLGVLGFVFWQNFINKPTADTKVEDTPSISTEQPATNDTELTQTATTSYGETTMAIQYPKSWTLASDSDTLTSADGKVSIFFTLTPPDGIGGTCADAAEANPVQDPIISARWAAIPNSPKSIFSAYIAQRGVSSGKYFYGFGAVRNTDEIKNIEVGSSACVPFMFANYIDLDVVSGATLRAVVSFESLPQEDDLTREEIENEFESTNAKIAESIIESISVK